MNHTKCLFTILLTLVVIGLTNAQEIDSLPNQALLEYFSIKNARSISDLWAELELVKEQVEQLESENASLKVNRDILNSNIVTLQTELSKVLSENASLQSQVQILKYSLEKQSKLDILNFAKTLYQMVDSASTSPELDTALFFSNVLKYLKSDKLSLEVKSQFTETPDTLFIEIPDRLSSSYFKSSELKVHLTKEQNNPNQPFIILEKGSQTTPYLSPHPSFEHIQTDIENSNSSWTIFYATKHIDEQYSLELRFTGHKIYGQKVELLVNKYDPKLGIPNLWNWLIYNIKKTEGIFVILITLLTNVGKILSTIKEIFEKWFGIKKHLTNDKLNEQTES